MAVPVLEDFTSNNTGGSNSDGITLSYPATVNSGDLLIALVGSDNTFGGDYWDTITGWTRIGTCGDTTSDCSGAAYYRVADGSETGTVDFTEGGFTNNATGYMLRISGADGTNPINDSAFGQSSSSSSSHTAPSVTTDVDDTLNIAGIVTDGGDLAPFTVTGTGWTEEAEQQNSNSGTTAAQCFASKEQASSGSSTGATFGCSASDGAAYLQLAVAPTTGGASTTPKSVSASATGTPSASLAIEYLQSAQATATGTPSLGRLIGAIKQIAATGTPSLATVATHYKQVSASATGTPSLAYSSVLGMLLQVTATGTASAATVTQWYHDAQAAATGTASRLSELFNAPSMTAVATAAVVRKVMRTVQIGATGTASQENGLLSQLSRGFSATGTASSAQSYIAGLSVQAGRLLRAIRRVLLRPLLRKIFNEEE